jgi:general secretion pathway protein I
MTATTMRARNTGFTLIEAVVALAVLGLSLGALYASFGETLGRAGEQQQRDAAMLSAQSVLARLRASPTLAAGQRSGELGELRWTADIADYPLALAPASRFKAYEVTVNVAWGPRAAQRVTLRSVETGVAGP